MAPNGQSIGDSNFLPIKNKQLKIIAPIQCQAQLKSEGNETDKLKKNERLGSNKMA